MRIVVSGGAGFIGSQVADAYLARGHEVLVVDDLSTGDPQNVAPQIRFLHVDARGDEAARQVRAFAPEMVNLHAAQIDVRRSVREPRLDADINICGVINLVEAGRLGGALKRVVYAASGGSMYGDAAPVPATEDAPPAPASFYGASKYAAELYLRCFTALYGIHHVALRYANIYGPRQNVAGEAGVVAIFCERLLRGADCTIYGDGRQTRDFTFVGDVVRANLAASFTSYCGGINIGTARETSVNALYSAVSEAIGVKMPPQFAAPRAGEQQRSALNNALAKSALGWTPETDLPRGLGETAAWYRQTLGRRGP